MENGDKVDSKVSPNYVRKPGPNVRCIKQATEPIEASGRGGERDHKVGACGSVAGDLPRVPYPVFTSLFDGESRELLKLHAHWPQSINSQKAKSLGSFRERKGGYRPWSEEADRMLIACEGLEMKVIAKRMRRSITSIRSRLGTLDRGAESFGGFKAKNLMEMLHLDESAIRRMERRHLLLRERGRITEDSVKCLCREHPGEIPFETLDEETKRTLVTDYEYPIPVFDLKKK